MSSSSTSKDSIQPNTLFPNEAAFLWAQRHHTAQSLITGLDALKPIDERLEAATEGLLLDPETSYQACLELLEQKEPGALSILISLWVLAHFPEDWSETISKQIRKWDNAQQETVGALAWLPLSAIQALYEAGPAQHVVGTELLLQVLCKRHYVPPTMNFHLLQQADDPVQQSGLRLAALTRQILDRQIMADTQLQRLSAYHYYQAVMGQLFDQKKLADGISQNDISLEEGLPVLLLRLTFDEIRGLIAYWQQQQATQAAIWAIGISGYPEWVDYLFDLANKSTALTEQKHIAYAIHLITGQTIPEYIQDEDNGLGEELTALELVDFLPIPDFGAMQNQWEQIRASFKNSQRYRVGKPLDADWLSAQIKQSSQYARHIAAIEFALIHQSSMLDIHAPYWRQQTADSFSNLSGN
jgi:hypothetical protein